MMNSVSVSMLAVAEVSPALRQHRVIALRQQADEGVGMNEARGP